MSHSEINQISGYLCAFLIVVHLFSEQLRKYIFEKRVIFHLSGGIVFAFLFIHMLPEFAEQGQDFSEYMHRVGITFRTQIVIYFIAMLGFMFFMGISTLVSHARNNNMQKKLGLYFYMHRSSYLIFNGLIAYTMPLRVKHGAGFSALFVLALAAHLVMIDIKIKNELRQTANYFVYVFFPLIIFLGWFAAYITEPDNIILVAILSAFVAGGIMHDIFSNEMPKEQNDAHKDKVAFLQFFSGGLIGSLLLVLLNIFQFL